MQEGNTNSRIARQGIKVLKGKLYNTDISMFDEKNKITSKTSYSTYPQKKTWEKMACFL